MKNKKKIKQTKRNEKQKPPVPQPPKDREIHLFGFGRHKQN